MRITVPPYDTSKAKVRELLAAARESLTLGEAAKLLRQASEESAA